MPRTAYLDHAGPLALAHRGFSREGWENSMVAFGAAVDLGYRYVETDVHATSDGVALAFHDESLDRVTDRTGQIARLPWREVRRARIGGVQPIPTLEELLATWPTLNVNIDVKSMAAAAPTAAAVEALRAHHRVCIASFSERRRRRTLRRLSAPVATSAAQVTVAAFRAAAVLPGRLGAMATAATLRDVDGLQVPVSFRGVPVVTARTVDAAHRGGAFVHVWTVNERAEMVRLLDLGVDGLVTDEAEVLKEVLVERGRWR